jgi:hypothetical protein
MPRSRRLEVTMARRLKRDNEFSALYTPQQNGVAERKNWTLIEMARAILDEYKTSDRFWTEEVNTTCHTTNRLYLHKLLKKTSYELLTINKPSVSYFWVFGSSCYVLQKRSKSSKFAPKVYKGFLLGYDSISHAYRVFNMNSSCVEITCDMLFDETNGYQKEQVDLELVDDEEAPCDALQRMAIGDVRPQDPSDQLQGQSPKTPLHLRKGLIKISMKVKMSTMINSKRRAMMKGEMRMMGIMEKATHMQDHHIQEYATTFKEIMPWTTYLVILRKW